MGSSHPTSKRLSEENHNSKRCMHPNVHSSTIYNRQDIEATQMLQVKQVTGLRCAMHIHIQWSISQEKE